MGQADRISVDVSDLRSQIDTYERSKGWRKLPLAKKVITMLEDALGIRDEKRILRDFLRDMAYGHPLHKYSCTVIADIVGIEPDVIERLKHGSTEQRSGESERPNLGFGGSITPEGE